MIKKFTLPILSILFILSTATANGNEYRLLTEYEHHLALLRSVGESRDTGNKGILFTYCTIQNRLNRGYGNGNIEHVLNAYYASDVEYTEQESDYVLEHRKNCPREILYALSRSDINYLGRYAWEANYVVVGGTVDNPNGYAPTYYFSHWVDRR